MFVFSLQIITLCFTLLLAVFIATNKAFGDVDICVNSAGVLDEVNWRRMMQINLVCGAVYAWGSYRFCLTAH